MSGTVLCARLDSAGDVLLTGPAIRAVAAHAGRVVLLAGPAGAAAGRLLPGVDEVLVWRCPWIGVPAAAFADTDVMALVARLTALDLEAAIIFTSFHQSPLPMALLARLAGVPFVAAISEDYPGSLLDVRHRVKTDLPEAVRALSLAEAAGYPLPSGDDARLRLRGPLPDVRHLLGEAPYVVLHPGATAEARRWPAANCAEAVDALVVAGWTVVVTGNATERALTAHVCGRGGIDLGGLTDLAQAAAVLAGARATVVGNTGPAHLSAAVGTPVVSLFAPVVPAARWAPYGVPHLLLGDQMAPCRGTYSVRCPVPGHPCLTSVTASDVVDAVRQLAGAPR